MELTNQIRSVLILLFGRTLHSVQFNWVDIIRGPLPQNVVLVSPPPLADKENSNRVGGGSASGGHHAALDRKISTSSTASSIGHGGCGNVDKLKIIDFGLARELGKQGWGDNSSFKELSFFQLKVPENGSHVPLENELSHICE